MSNLGEEVFFFDWQSQDIILTLEKKKTNRKAVQW